MRQSTSITGCVRWSVGLLVGLSGNAFVLRSTRRTLLAYFALLFAIFDLRGCRYEYDHFQEKADIFFCWGQLQHFFITAILESIILM